MARVIGWLVPCVAGHARTDTRVGMAQERRDQYWTEHLTTFVSTPISDVYTGHTSDTIKAESDPGVFL